LIGQLDIVPVGDGNVRYNLLSLIELAVSVLIQIIHLVVNWVINLRTLAITEFLE